MRLMLWTVGMRGDPQGEPRAGAGLAPELYVPAVVGGNVLAYCQPQPGAAGRSTPRLIDAEEPLEDAFLMLGRNAQAAVSDGDLHQAVHQPSTDGHRTTRRRVRHRIAKQVGQRGHQERRITIDQQPAGWRG